MNETTNQHDPVTKPGLEVISQDYLRARIDSSNLTEEQIEACVRAGVRMFRLMAGMIRGVGELSMDDMALLKDAMKPAFRNIDEWGRLFAELSNLGLIGNPGEAEPEVFCRWIGA